VLSLRQANVHVPPTPFSCTSLPLFPSIVLLPVVHHVIELGDQEERYKLARRVQTSVIGFGELKECTIGTVLSFFKPKD